MIATARHESPHHNLVPQLLVKEEMWDELLKLMQSGNRYTIEPYRNIWSRAFQKQLGTFTNDI